MNGAIRDRPSVVLMLGISSTKLVHTGSIQEIPALGKPLEETDSFQLLTGLQKSKYI
jgi:hypothetical protein